LIGFNILNNSRRTVVVASFPRERPGFIFQATNASGRFRLLFREVTVPATPNIFSSDFSEKPYWWNDWHPHDAALCEVPKQADVAIVGAGYAGLACALELRKSGMDVVVLEADVPGSGASTISGGQTSGGANVGKKPTGRSLDSAATSGREIALLQEAAEGYRIFEALLEQHKIDCLYRRDGRIVAAWTSAHLDAWKIKLEKLNRYTAAEGHVMSREEMRSELDSSIYAGGVLLKRAGQVHPALYFAGLLRAARDIGVTVCSHAAVKCIAKNGGGFRLDTVRGPVSAKRVVIATNGYTGEFMPDLQRRVIPVTSHQIATEELPEDLRKSLIPNNRVVAETKRISIYYRMSPDGKRVLFGGRARFYKMNRRESATILHAQLVARFPQLRDVKVAYSWGGFVGLTFDFLPHINRTEGMYYALGCNGSGVTMMTYLGYKTAHLIIDCQAVETSAFGKPLPTNALYRGNPWFMPLVGTYYQVRDSLERTRDRA
jgi:glycine/D-amino acid oxidase-like deaminating enzyme